MAQASGIREMRPDKGKHTCTFVLEKSAIPEGAYLAPETYKDIRQGLVKARLNYTILDLQVTVLEEDDDTLTLKIEGVEA